LRSANAQVVNAGAVVAVTSGDDNVDELTGFAAGLVVAGAGGVLLVGSIIDKNGQVSGFSDDQAPVPKDRNFSLP